MTKKEFLAKLKRKLLKLPRKELTERVGFYNEIIDDKIEDGFSEEDAVADVGDVEQIAEQILKEKGLDTSSVKKASGAQIALLIIGAPVWLLIIYISLFAVLFAVCASLWAVFVSLAAVALSGIVLFVVYIALGNMLLAFIAIGTALVCAGLAILMFFASRYTTKGSVSLMKSVTMGIVDAF